MTKASLQRLVTRYAKQMNLAHWDIDVFLSKEWNCDGAAAECSPNPTYERASITIYQSAFRKPNCIHAIIKHELAHCLTEQMYRICVDMLNHRVRTHDDINEQRELLTERISKLVRP